MEQTIIIFAIILMIILREGFQQRDNIAHTKKLSKTWHAMGFVMRALVFVLLYLRGVGWVLLVVAGLSMWMVYNITCNIGRKQKWYYVGKSGIDGVIRKVLPFINFDK